MTDLVDNNLIRRDHYMTRETLKTEQGKTTLPIEHIKHKKYSKLENFEPEIYTRVGNTLCRNQNVLRNTVHNITTLHGARELMAGHGKTQEQRLLYAVNYESAKADIKNAKYHDEDLKTDVTPTEHNFMRKDPIITTYITPTGKEIPDKLLKVMDHLGKKHLKGKMHKNMKHGDAGLPVGEQQF